MYGWYYDPTFILVFAGLILTLIASAGVKSTFSRYSRVRCMAGYTGAQAAQEVLRISGIYDVRIERVAGELTDHYDPRAKVLRLSDSTYGSNSVAAVCVAAHECGHAIQHQKGYGTSKHTGSGSQHRFQSFLADFCCRADFQHASASDARYSSVWTGCDLSACDTAG